MKKWLLGLLTLSLLVGCQNNTPKLKVAVTPVPHAEMLEQIKPDMKERGINLEIVVVEDYTLPNRLLSEGRVDANFFQHTPFLDMQVKEFGYDLVVLETIHVEPLGIYSKKIKELSSLKDGAIVAIPNDPTNEARALQLLAAQGLIELDPSSTLATPLDVTNNPKKLKFREIDASLLPRTITDVDIAVIPSNFALQANLEPTQDALALEPADSPYANILVIRRGDENREELQILAELLTSDKSRAYIQNKYKGAILPAF